MEKKNQKHPTKDLFIAHVLTINPDAYSRMGQLTQDILILKRQTIQKNKTILVPLEKYNQYYSIEKMIPISEKMKKQYKYIKNSEVKRIEEIERQTLLGFGNTEEKTNVKTKKLSA